MQSPLLSGMDADPDGDGVGNWDEYIADTHPLRADSAPAIVGMTPGGEGAWIHLGILSTGRLYDVFWATNLQAPNWVGTVWSNLPGGATNVSLPVGKSAPRIYYKTKIRLP